MRNGDWSHSVLDFIRGLSDLSCHFFVVGSGTGDRLRRLSGRDHHGHVAAVVGASAARRGSVVQDSIGDEALAAGDPVHPHVAVRDVSGRRENAVELNPSARRKRDGSGRRRFQPRVSVPDFETERDRAS